MITYKQSTTRNIKGGLYKIYIDGWYLFGIIPLYRRRYILKG